jgi:hypothetical protein
VSGLIIIFPTCFVVVVFLEWFECDIEMIVPIQMVLVVLVKKLFIITVILNSDCG